MLANIRFHHGGDDVDISKEDMKDFTSETVTRMPSLWSGHGPKADGTWALGEVETADMDLHTLVQAAAGQHTLPKTVYYIRAVLLLLHTE